MAISPTDIAYIADHLMTIDSEAASRSAVSRYFYATLHSAEAWMGKLPGMPSAAGHTGGTHQLVINRLRNPDPLCTEPQKKASRMFAAKLEILRNRRVQADYYINETPTAGEINNQQAQARKIMSDMS